MQYSPYYKGHELVFQIHNMEELAKGFKVASLIDCTPKHYRKYVELEVASPAQPRPWLRCAACLYRLGFGYDRIIRYLRVRGVHQRNKKSISNYIKKRRSRGLRKPPLRPRPKSESKPTYVKLTPEQWAERYKLTAHQHKAKARLRSYFSQWVNSGLYPQIMHQIVGCDLQFFRHWISSQFTKNMDWSNHGTVWHFDHKIPCKAFDLTQKQQVLKCWHFSNIRPLHSKKNLQKSARIEPTQMEILLRH